MSEQTSQSTNIGFVATARALAIQIHMKRMAAGHYTYNDDDEKWRNATAHSIQLTGPTLTVMHVNMRAKHTSRVGEYENEHTRKKTSCTEKQQQHQHH